MSARSRRRNYRPPAGRSSEHQEQTLFFQSIRAIPHPAVHLTFAVPNGSLRNRRSRMWFLAEGFLPGVSDVIVLYPSPLAPFLALEFKYGGRMMRPTQRLFAQRVIAAGGAFALVRSSTEAFDIWAAHVGVRQS